MASSSLLGKFLRNFPLASICLLNWLLKHATNLIHKRWAQYPNRPQMKENRDRVIIASDVNERDGIGIEIYRNDELIAEIFRNAQKEVEQSEFLKKIFHLN